MQLCTFVFAVKRVASICVNKKQRKLTLHEKYSRGKESRAGFGYIAKKLDGIRASCPHFPIQMKKRNECLTKEGKGKDL